MMETNSNDRPYKQQRRPGTVAALKLPGDSFLAPSKSKLPS